jgi:hypothetical protein
MGTTLMTNVKVAAAVSRILLVLGILAAAVSLGGGSAQAQATRTWVSGVGDDANPCSRTAPCKTFAGAISKTAPGGEINCIDPGGFGGVTITKAITISCEGVTAGVLVSGTNAIVVNAGANDQIALRGLDIDGLGTGLVAVKFLAGKALIVENCQIYGFTQNGIEAALAATASVDVKDTRINNVVGAGIKVHTTAGNVALLADHVAISRVGTNGVEAAGGALGTVSNSTIFAASNAVAATANGATLNVDNTELLSSLVGANATVAGAILELNNNSIYFNNTAIGGAVGSQVLTAANNKLSGNASPGANPSGNVTIK